MYNAEIKQLDINEIRVTKKHALTNFNPSRLCCTH